MRLYGQLCPKVNSNFLIARSKIVAGQKAALTMSKGESETKRSPKETARFQAAVRFWFVISFIVIMAFLINILWASSR